MVTFDAQAAGTPRRCWDADERLASLPTLTLRGVTSLVIVSAHPDDETLGCGGLIVRASDAGIPIRIVAVTDGSASHPRSSTVPGEDMAHLRSAELREAVGYLATAATISWLGFPDGQTLDFEADIEQRLREELHDGGAGTVVAVTWAGDGHRDHRVVGTIVDRIVPPGATLWRYPIWMWHWATPETPGLPWETAASLTLTPFELARKRRAVGAFGSQISPLSSAEGDERVLTADVLTHFDRDREMFFLGGDRMVAR